MEHGIEAIDRTAQKSIEWINDVSEEMGPAEDSQRGYQATRAVLQALRDRLTVDEAADLGAQLPAFLRGVYYEGFRPSDLPVKMDDRDRFYGRVSDNLGNAAPAIASDQATRAVLKTLQKRISDGEIRDVRQLMPAELQDLWPL